MSEPKTVAIIMDGNRRWAKKNNLPIPSGHRKGIESLIEIVKTAKKLKIERLIVYAFSTENWSRDNFEVNALMNLINFGVDVKLNEIKENGIKLDFIGNLADLPEKAKKGIDKCINETKDLSELTLTVALNYGAISDILEAAKTINKNNIELNEENFLNATQIGGQEVDIFIRTGGDRRLSNFLLANIGYTELFFSDKLWPEFSNNDFIKILDEFRERQRRFGK
ncbi:MAG: di-trans,poly-cis-decaprenylcistransferase [Gammaproteobacteria bacterium]|nr:di-trans,poly-cis-decaprenylcistransferase [Gammaproteobacteria bacterium]|tara:strand:- start:279 stop:950 length:672 start_codon:yes stop_codon:yes gene_type:complete